MSNSNFSDYLNELADADGGVESVVSEGIENLKGKIKDVKVEAPKAKEPNPVRDTKVKNAVGLADRAINTYKTKINPPIDAPTSLEDAAPKEIPSTIASRESMKALTRSLAGMRSSGNEGKVSPNGEHGGNLGKISPVDMNGCGNVSSPMGGYAADVAGMTLESMEEYQARVLESFGVEQEVVEEEIEEEVEVTEGTVDLIGVLEEALLEHGASDWQSVDAVTRRVCEEWEILPKELNREFRAQHGVYPDKWILAQEEVEECGMFPLSEAALLHKVGLVYDVSFLFRGGRASFKFFWPTATRPSQEEMQKAVELFYPKARLLAYYPSRDQGANGMVVVPPMTENYHMVAEEDWVTLSDGDAAILEEISEEWGEPLDAPVLQEDGTYEVLIANHDTGEEEVIEFGEAAAWTRKEGQNSKGGLNEKGRKSYERENPGSDLKRPQPEGGSRRDSYCARSRGQQKMHNIDCSKDPDKRICKARRKWNC